MKKMSLLATTFLAGQTLLGAAWAEVPPPPTADVETPYYDRHKIDVSNLRDFYEGILIADMMIHADAMFDAETKWKITLYEMIKVGSNHHQARAARQLAELGVPIAEIQAIYAPDYTATIEGPRIRAAFEFVDAASVNPAKVTSDTHAALRTHFIDRQIAELVEIVGINAAMAKHDLLLPIPTDQATIDWATKNLGPVGWKLGLNKASSAEEQRAAPFIGKALATAHAEIIADWEPGDLTAEAPRLASDWVNHITGYDISRITFDGDQDGIEEPFDFYPTEYLRWEDPAADAANQPPEGTPPFDVAGYDYAFYKRQELPEAKYPLSDRMKFDTEWTRESSLGTTYIDEYFSGKDRALTAAAEMGDFRGLPDGQRLRSLPGARRLRHL
jgi:hypothetical protein